MERIVGVAIKIEDSFFGQINPARHHHLLHAMSRLGMKKHSGNDQGFYTSEGRWVDRKEALRIAQDANQIIEKVGNSSILFSEDLW